MTSVSGTGNGIGELGVPSGGEERWEEVNRVDGGCEIYADLGVLFLGLVVGCGLCP